MHVSLVQLAQRVLLPHCACVYRHHFASYAPLFVDFVDVEVDHMDCGVSCGLEVFANVISKQFLLQYHLGGTSAPAPEEETGGLDVWVVGLTASTPSSPMASLVLTDSSQLTSDGFEKLPDQIMYPYTEICDLQKHIPSSFTLSDYNMALSWDLHGSGTKKATLLGPRLKGTVFQDESALNKAVNRLILETDGLTNSNAETIDEPATLTKGSAQGTSNGMWSFYNKLMTKR
uniref:Uncharacterized protein n=1 Tax=Timema poppense TaxID=170557 RepID=A0A7R9DCC2_TIMPO|nr:unnamed protein product [Timema poppensis]